MGFDHRGNPLPGRETALNGISDNSISREKCVQFFKHRELVAPAHFFPDAANLKPFRRLSDDIRASRQNASKLLPDLQAPSTPPAYHERDLINMTRYRNILRYQLGRTIDQPLVHPPPSSSNDRVSLPEVGNYTRLVSQQHNNTSFSDPDNSKATAIDDEALRRSKKKDLRRRNRSRNRKLPTDRRKQDDREADHNNPAGNEQSKVTNFQIIPP